MSRIGFVLLTHAHESQALRLVERLGFLFDDPPIVCHHDFSQARFDSAHFPSNVRFVDPHVRTSWGSITLVEAMMRGLRLLYEISAPDWFYFLSGSDYPVRSAAAIRSELRETPFDAFMQLRKIDHTRAPRATGQDTGGLDSPSYARLAYQRYIARKIPVPHWKHPHRGPAAMHLHLMNPRLLRPFHPFDDKFHCYAGGQWFAANARSAAALLAPGTDRILKYFKGRFPPDEAVCQTVLGNTAELKICPESKHYLSWEQGHHPRMLTSSDLPAIFASKAHFARKFAPDSHVLDLIDEQLGIPLASREILRAKRH